MIHLFFGAIIVTIIVLSFTKNRQQTKQSEKASRLVELHSKNHALLSSSQKFANHLALELSTQQARIREAGSINGIHFSDHTALVQKLKRERRHDEAITLLLNLIDSTEAESKVPGFESGVAPWYYEQLAIIYRKDGRLADEVAILKRYAAQSKAPGAGPAKLAARLSKT